MTAPASAPALRIFAGTTEGRLLCEWASGAGIPARAYAATEYGGELLGELPGIEVHAGRLDEADMERELSGARIVVDATHPIRYARKRQHPGRFARCGCTMPAPCASG